MFLVLLCASFSVSSMLPIRPKSQSLHALTSGLKHQTSSSYLRSGVSSAILSEAFNATLHLIHISTSVNNICLKFTLRMKLMLRVKRKFRLDCDAVLTIPK